ncbi:Anp1-domain-containing protein [Fennellomyces sp. T-0311]|nr:Anp1-domain-containing protein [Fennellomyces sp. T-0311]
MLFSARMQVIAIVLASCCLVYWLFSSSPSLSSSWTCVDDGTITSHVHSSQPNKFRYYDMDKLNATDQGHKANEHVLILTPFKDAAQHIDRYFAAVNKLTYPHHLISLGFLVSDSSDGTIEKLHEKSRSYTRDEEGWQQFHRISIFQKDFDFELSNTEERHAFGVQVERRKIMAKSRNTLLSSALTEEIAWVLWLDGDVFEYPATLLEELIGMNKDVLAPNCWWHSYNEEAGYDRNNWQETPESREFQKGLEPDDVLVEGYPELITHRKLMIDMRFENDQTELFHAVPLDAVGGTCTLVKAEVHREGAIFPTFPFQHQVETEGFAKMAKALGYEVWGLPNYLVYHYI